MTIVLCGSFRVIGGGGPVGVVFYDVQDELHVDGEDELNQVPACEVEA